MKVQKMCNMVLSCHKWEIRMARVRHSPLLLKSIQHP